MTALDVLIIKMAELDTLATTLLELLEVEKVDPAIEVEILRVISLWVKFKPLGMSLVEQALRDGKNLLKAHEITKGGGGG